MLTYNEQKNYQIRKAMFLKDNKLLNQLIIKNQKYIHPDTLNLIKYYLESCQERKKRIYSNKDRSYPLFILTSYSQIMFKKNHLIVEKEAYILLSKTKPSPRLGQKLVLTGGKESRNLVISGNKTENIKYMPETYKFLNKMIKESNKDYQLVSFNVSIMQPRTHIRWHVGFSEYSDYVTRHIYGINVPDFCSINTLDEVKQIKEKDFIYFQDINNHEAWNMSDDYRLVIIFDVTHKDYMPIIKKNINNFQKNKNNKSDDPLENFNATLGKQIYDNFH